MSYLTIGEAAERLRVSRNTMYRLVRERRIDAIHAGSAIRIPEESIVQMTTPAVPYAPDYQMSRIRVPASRRSAPRTNGQRIVTKIV